MERCAQMSQTVYTMASDSSADKVYTVRAFLPDGSDPTCDCTAFAISRNRDGGKNHGGKGWCKHVQRALAGVCQWQATPDAEPQTIPGVCPRCGGPTTPDAAPTFIPENPKEQVATVTESLLKMAADLEARQS